MPTIEFIPLEDNYANIFDPPDLAINCLPDWYKSFGLHAKIPIEFRTDNPDPRTVKACMPVFDMLTAGYIFKAQCDVTFYQNNGQIFSKSSRPNFHFISTHDRAQIPPNFISEEFYNIIFIFDNYWTIRTPKGYSTMFFQPVWRPELPFTVFPGIVDTDKHPVPVNFPFLLRKNFEGIIKLDTPLVQLVPFKREEWNSVNKNYPEKDLLNKWDRLRRSTYNVYKKNIRTIKTWK